MISGDRPSDGESGTSRLDFRFYQGITIVLPNLYPILRPREFDSAAARASLNAAESAGTPPACVL
jgi:hypothetical protein